jgi:hypothetical protein
MFICFMGYQKPNRLMLASEGFPEHLLLLCSWKLVQSVEPQAADLVYGATGIKHTKIIWI